MSRILLTGASGFIGQHVLSLLAAGDVDVHAISRLPRTAKGVTFHACDLLGEPAPIFDLFAKVKPTHLLHLAWYAEQKKYWTSPENFRWVAASLNMARAFHEHGGRRLLGVGTCAEYDWRYGFCSEVLTPLGPTSPYGICKDSLRRLWESFAQLNSLSFAWARVFFPYGPGEPSTRLIPSVIRALLDGNVARCTH